MKYLYRFYWDFGRSGSLEGLFVATEEEVNESIGAYVYFGEVLGKHSEVYGNLKSRDFKKLDISPESVKEVSAILGEVWGGFNPLKCIETSCEECGDTMPKDEWKVERRHEFEMDMCEECYEESLENLLE